MKRMSGLQCSVVPHDPVNILKNTAKGTSAKQGRGVMSGSARSEKEDEKAKTVTTLIIEDSAIFRRLLKETLQHRFPEMNIVEAMNGQEGMKWIEASPPDLIFMDIKLPDESGLELTKKIKAQHPEVVIVILTSYDTPEYREAAAQYQANHFLSKGLTTREGILALVTSILADL